MKRELLFIVALLLGSVAFAQTDELSGVVQGGNTILNMIDDVTPVAAETYDAVTDFTSDAATVGSNVVAVSVDITDLTDDLVLTLPTNPKNIGNTLTLVVALDGTVTGKLDVVMSATVTAEEVENGKYLFQCIAPGTWTEVGGCQAIQELLGVTAGLVTAAPTAYTAYTIPDQTSALAFGHKNTDAGTKVEVVLTLPTGAECIGKTIGLTLDLGDNGEKHTVDVVLGSAYGTLTTLDNGMYSFYCMAAGDWTRLLAPQSGALSDFGPGTSITGNTSAYNEDLLLLIIDALENAGICSDGTTT